MAEAHVVNRTDQTITVNANFGATAPFAQGVWVFTRGQYQRSEVPVPGDADTSWIAFRAGRLREIPAGQMIEVARISTTKELKRLEDGRGEWQVHFTYANLCDRSWQRRQGAALAGKDHAPEVLREPLPRRMLSARLTSPRTKIPRRIPITD